MYDSFENKLNKSILNNILGQLTHGPKLSIACTTFSTKKIFANCGVHSWTTREISLVDYIDKLLSDTEQMLMLITQIFVSGLAVRVSKH